MREKLIKILSNFYGADPAYFGVYAPALADHLLANGLTAQEWIPVTERMPEESGMYIVAAKDGRAQRTTFVIWQKRNKVWNLTGARSYWKVTHWMPLPEPPKGE